MGWVMMIGRGLSLVVVSDPVADDRLTAYSAAQVQDLNWGQEDCGAVRAADRQSPSRLCARMPRC